MFWLSHPHWFEWLFVLELLHFYFLSFFLQSIQVTIFLTCVTPLNMNSYGWDFKIHWICNLLCVSCIIFRGLYDQLIVLLIRVITFLWVSPQYRWTYGVSALCKLVVVELNIDCWFFLFQQPLLVDFFSNITLTLNTMETSCHFRLICSHKAAF